MEILPYWLIASSCGKYCYKKGGIRNKCYWKKAPHQSVHAPIVTWSWLTNIQSLQGHGCSSNLWRNPIAIEMNFTTTSLLNFLLQSTTIFTNSFPRLKAISDSLFFFLKSIHWWQKQLFPNKSPCLQSLSSLASKKIRRVI